MGKGTVEEQVQVKNQFNKDIFEFNKSVSGATRYEEARIMEKQNLKDMVLFYKPLGNGDEGFSSIMKIMASLSNYRATGGWDYWCESDSFKKAAKGMEKYLDNLDKQRSALESQAAGLFKVTENGRERWLSDAEIAANPELQEKDRQLCKKMEDLDNRELAVSDMLCFLESQKQGRLPYDDKTAEAATKKNGWRFIDGRGKKLNTEQTDIAENKLKTFSANFKDAPLFPHEPNANDIQQGHLGDCYFLSTLSNIARLHPEEIRNMLHDNGDGSVTVRLYSRDEYNNYKPVFVVVDKNIDTAIDPVGNEGLKEGNLVVGAKNCLWASCLERAMMISGLNAFPHHDRSNILEPVPENIEEISNRLQELENKGELKGTKLHETVDKYPWLFVPEKMPIMTKDGLIGHYEPPKFIPWPNIQTFAGGKSYKVTGALLGPKYTGELLAVPKADNMNDRTLSPEQQLLFDRIKEAVRRNCIVAAGSNEDPDLVFKTHSYSILDVYRDDKGNCYLSMRNPHGDLTRRDGDNGVESIVKEDGTVVNTKAGVDQGIFQIEFKTFCSQFVSVDVSGMDQNLEIIGSQPAGSVRLNDRSILNDSEKTTELLIRRYLSNNHNKSELSDRIDNKVISNELRNNLWNTFNMSGDYGLEYATNFEARLKENVEAAMAACGSDRTNPVLFMRKLSDTLADKAAKTGDPGIKAVLEGFKKLADDFNEEISKPYRDKLEEEQKDKQLSELIKKGRALNHGQLEPPKVTEEDIIKAASNELSRDEKMLNQTFESGRKHLERIKNGELTGKMYMGNVEIESSNIVVENLYTDQSGRKMVKLNAYGREREMTLVDAMLVHGKMGYDDPRQEVCDGTLKPGQEKVQSDAAPETLENMETETLGFQSFRQYLKVLSDLDETFQSTASTRSKDSKEYQNLRQALKDTMSSVSKLGGKDIDLFRQSMEKLEEPISDYERHCAEKHRYGSRRATRMKACSMLKNVLEAARSGEKLPNRENQREYAGRILKAANQKMKDKFTPQQLDGLTYKMLEDPRFRGFIENKNIFDIKHSSDRTVAKEAGLIQEEISRFSKKNESKDIVKNL